MHLYCDACEVEVAKAPASAVREMSIIRSTNYMIQAMKMHKIVKHQIEVPEPVFSLRVDAK